MRFTMLTGLLLAGACLALPAAGQTPDPPAESTTRPPEAAAPRTPVPQEAQSPAERRAGSGSQQQFEPSGDNFGSSDGGPGGSARTDEDVGGSAGGSAGSFIGSEQRPGEAERKPDSTGR